MNTADDILQFWFGTLDLKSEMEKKDIWFRSTPEFDAAIEDKFLATYEKAAAGELDDLKTTAAGCLALIITLDQFPRNLFRGTAKSFAADPRARDYARHFIDNEFDNGLDDWPRVFAYLPFEHSEDLADQDKSVELFSLLSAESSVESAVAHRDTVVRFGRFPHRNVIVGRDNTPEEEDYLKDPPTWGKSAAEVEEAEKQKAGE